MNELLTETSCHTPNNNDVFSTQCTTNVDIINNSEKHVLRETVQNKASELVAEAINSIMSDLWHELGKPLMKAFIIKIRTKILSNMEMPENWEEQAQ